MEILERYGAKTHNITEFASNLYKLRVNENRRQSEMARSLGVTQQTYSLMETGKLKSIPHTIAQQVADRLRKPLDEVIPEFSDIAKQDPDLFNWISDTKKSLPYLLEAFGKYKKEKGLIPKDLQQPKI